MSKYDNVINELLKPAGTEEEISDEEANIYDGDTEGGGVFPFDISGLTEEIEQDAYEEERTDLTYDIHRIDALITKLEDIKRLMREEYPLRALADDFLVQLCDVEDEVATLMNIAGDF